jgi:Flp pilus assembly protein TadG
VTRSGDEAGLASLELALLMPVLLFWVMLIVQFGLWFHAKQVAVAAASEAVDAARLPGSTTTEAEAGALTMSRAGNLADPVVNVDRDARQITVRVEGRAPQLVPGFAWTVAARQTAPVERFVAP